jgi:putative Ca2+/H+ antiporter (TMEM165/GDT1 family)
LKLKRTINLSDKRILTEDSIYTPTYEILITMATINGETITGVALSFLAILFIYAGLVNSVWAKILPADYFLLIMGIAFIVLGVFTMRKNRRNPVKEHSH